MDPEEFGALKSDIKHIRENQDAIYNLVSRFEEKYNRRNEEVDRELSATNEKSESFRADVASEMANMKVEIAVIKVKAGVIGVIAGATPGLLMLLANYL